ncbi:MAG: ABC transporter ATP-binding protein [Lewinellaceae bacterium]|nr:ABC transporter ATP-binding protein [Lewinellaceae bacterium]
MQLTINNLNKTYPNGVRALQDVSLEIPTGMYGLLGPNGAGKSTLMRTLATLQDADSGTATLGDINVLTDKDEVRRVLGYLPQEFGVYPRISAVEMLDHLAVLKGIPPAQRKEVVNALLQRVNLWDHRKKSVSSYSGGMRQRFGIAQALLGDPKLIIVDEPTAGLDPGERNRFYNLLSEIGENVIVILSTHIVEDVRELCSNMAIINNGQVLYAGAPDLALSELKGMVWEKAIAKSEIEDYQQQYRVISSKLVAGKPIIHVLSETNPDGGFKAATPGLEDVFFAKISAQEQEA